MSTHVYQPQRKPSKSQFLTGLPKIEAKLTSLQRALLMEQYASQEHRCFASDLAQRCGVADWRVVNRHYAYAAEKFCRVTEFDPSRTEKGRSEWWCVWSFGIGHSKGRWQWQMHPELVEALEQLGWVNPSADRGDLLAEEITPNHAYQEGAVRRILVNAVERDLAARAACIAAHGCRCSVCAFDFTTAYGSLGEGFIHVHHLRPLGDGIGERAVDPVSDLRPVCPNCHAMLHRRDPPLTLEELRVRMQVGASAASSRKSRAR